MEFVYKNVAKHKLYMYLKLNVFSSNKFISKKIQNKKDINLKLRK